MYPYFSIRLLPSSKTTLTDYQCVSTGCCTHVAKTEIAIDNQHVTKSPQRYIFLPKQPKENTENTQICYIFLIRVAVCQSNEATFIKQPKILFCYIFYDCLGRFFHLCYCAKTLSHIFQTCPHMINIIVYYKKLLLSGKTFSKKIN